MNLQRFPMLQFKFSTKHLVFSLALSYGMYNVYSDIERFLNETLFYFTETEDGFVKKKNAFNLSFIYEKNNKGNLETYLRDYTNRIPVFERENGLMVGTAKYNYSNFTKEERKLVCSNR